MARRAWTTIVVIAAVGMANWDGRPTMVTLDSRWLQGTWVITSVEKDGAADPTQLSAIVTFAGNTVEYAPASTVVPIDPARIKQLTFG